MTNIIAIDGPASVGKSTLAKKISLKYRAPLLMSGRLYRVVAHEILLNKIKLNDKKKILNCVKEIDEKKMKSRMLFSNNIDQVSSLISSKKYLREALMKYQRDFPKTYSKNKKFAVIEGRDIGTVIFPKAKYKIFMWANAEIRAKRRYEQVQKNGEKTSFNRIYNEINRRDKKDLQRKIAPLRPDVNSVLLDTSYLDIEQAFNIVIKLIEEHKSNG